MKPPPTLALIINTYNQPDYLNRVLAGVARQLILPDEVLLADDGSTDETREAFSKWSDGKAIRCEHVWQKNEGFRRSRILNQAIAAARSDYVIFLDGDTVPHPRFVGDHGALAQRQRFVQGHRALVEQEAAVYFGLGDLSEDRAKASRTGQLKGKLNARRWPFAWRTLRTDLRGIRGCNLSIWREDLIRTNGYDEAFVGWGREDADLAQRLMNNGVRRMDERGWAVCYHLWHPPASRAALTTNDKRLEETIGAKRLRCELGLDQYLVARP